MSNQRRAMWTCAVFGWLVISFPINGHETARGLVGIALLFAALILTGQFERRGG